MWWRGYERKEMEQHCQLREFLSAASDRSLRRTGTQTGLLLATGEALAAASLAASKTYMWVYVWVCVLVCHSQHFKIQKIYFFLPCVLQVFPFFKHKLLKVQSNLNMMDDHGFVSELDVPLTVCFLCLCVGVSMYPCVFYLCRFVSVYPMTHSPRCEWRRALGGLCHAAVCSFPEAWRPSFDK